MRMIGVVTTSRADYGIYYSTLRAVHDDPGLQLHLIVGGMHLSPEFGLTVEQIEADGFPIGDRIELLLSSDTPQAISKSMGLGMIGFADSYRRFRPDILVVLGDRFEMFAAAAASIPFAIPLAHIHGGETTEGAIDESLRHAMTKLAHLHFASTEAHARRIIQMGEAPWRVTVSGAPALDNLRRIKILERAEFEEQFGLTLYDEFLLVTYHPVTLEYEQTEEQVFALQAALEKSSKPIIFTYPNADTYGRKIVQMIEAFVRQTDRAQVAVNLGTQGYFSLMSHAGAMVGNSSSGIVEAASFELPVVNIGNRQRGRVHSFNVISVGYDEDDILEGIKQALSPMFKQKLQGMQNPYQIGEAAQIIVDTLESVTIDQALLSKRFFDIDFDSGVAHHE